jgi:hypothetical protein
MELLAHAIVAVRTSLSSNSRLANRRTEDGATPGVGEWRLRPAQAEQRPGFPRPCFPIQRAI